MRKEQQMTKWGQYTLTVTDRIGNVVKEIKYEGMSGTAMHDEAKYWSNQYPAQDGFTIDW
jgi:hypothetical protein